ncbi:MAG: TerB family tellurite resistance protein [SAR324 cluster bacterium]|nr:TerB family tellurite resistance protein [SAR324 cluster bacterium]
MTEDYSHKTEVKTDLQDLKRHAKEYTIEDIRSGEWFAKFLKYALESYAEKVNAEYFRKKHPHLTADAIVTRRIDTARKYAAIEGAVSAGAYSAAVAATVGSMGGGSPIAIPAAALSFIADLFYSTRLQLHLAYDMSVLYEHPVDMADPGDLYDLVKVAFGIKAGKMMQGTVVSSKPEVVGQGVKSVISGPALSYTFPIVGKYLLQRNIIKFSIPLVSIPLAAGMNYWNTGSVTRIVRQVYRDKAAIAKKVQQLVELKIDALILLQTVLIVMLVDQLISAEEAWLLNYLTKQLKLESSGRAAVKEFEEIIKVDEDELFIKLRALEQEQALNVFEAACYAAAVDHKVNKKKHNMLVDIADACRVKYDKKTVEKMAKDGLVSP